MNKRVNKLGGAEDNDARDEFTANYLYYRPALSAPMYEEATDDEFCYVLLMRSLNKTVFEPYVLAFNYLNKKYIDFIIIVLLFMNKRA